MARTHGAELSEAERFWARVDPQGECLIWTGTRNGDNAIHAPTALPAEVGE